MQHRARRKPKRGNCLWGGSESRGGSLSRGGSALYQVIPGNSVHQKKSAEDKTRADREEDQSKQVQIVNETSNGDSRNCKNNSDEREQGNMAKSKPQMQGKWRGVDPVVIFEDRDVINSIRSFYGIHDSFPLEGLLVTRNNDSSHVKRIYYISKSVVDNWD